MQEHMHGTTNHFSECKGKGKVNHAPQESVGGAHLPLLGLEPVGGRGEPLMSVTHGQCDARPSQPQGITARWLVPNYTAW